MPAILKTATDKITAPTRRRRFVGGAQCVAIARALTYYPRLLLLDEIASALEMGFARQVADTVYFLVGGKIIELGSAEQVLAVPQHERTAQFLRRVTGAGCD